MKYLSNTYAAQALRSKICQEPKHNIKKMNQLAIISQDFIYSLWLIVGHFIQHPDTFWCHCHNSRGIIFTLDGPSHQLHVPPSINHLDPPRSYPIPHVTSHSKLCSLVSELLVPIVISKCGLPVMSNCAKASLHFLRIFWDSPCGEMGGK